MMIAWLIIYLIVIGIAGFALAAGVFGHCRVRLGELIGAVVALGCGAVAWLLLTVSMMGLKPSRTIVLCIGCAATVAVVGLRRRLPRVATPLAAGLRGLDALTVIALALIVVQLYCAVAIALLPTFEIDAYAIWGLKAKVLYFEPLTPRPEYFSDLSLSFTHLDYPLLVPALWTGAYATMHAVDDSVGKVVLILPLIALIAMLYGSLRGLVDRPRAMLLTALATGGPVVGAFAGRGIADAALALFAFAATNSLVRWLRDDRRADAVLTGVFVGFAALTKLEGNPLILSCGIIVTLVAVVRWTKRRDRRPIVTWACFILGLVVVMVPWVLWSRPLPQTHENYPSRLTPAAIVTGINRLGDTLRAMWAQARLWCYTAPMAMLLFASVVGWRRWKDPTVIAAWAVLVAQIGAYVAVFLVTPWDVPSLAMFSVHRLFLHLAPIAMLLAGLHWQAVVGSMMLARPESLEAEKL